MVFYCSLCVCVWFYTDRLKLTSGELTSGRGSPSIGASAADEQAAAIAALTDLMEELEELGV